MKKKLLILITIILSILLTGCMTREPLNSHDFKMNMEKRGFTISDKTESQNNPSIIKYYVVTNKERTYNIEYYELNNEMDAQGLYLKYKESMIGTGVEVSTEINLGNSSKYAENYSGKYRVVSRISNTLIWVDAKVEYQEEIKALLKEIGY